MIDEEVGKNRAVSAAALAISCDVEMRKNIYRVGKTLR
jgi:hypothetical protein